MHNLRVVGTRGKKRKKLLKILLVPVLAVSAAGLLFLYTPLGGGFGNVFAGEKDPGEGTSPGKETSVPDGYGGDVRTGPAGDAVSGHEKFMSAGKEFMSVGDEFMTADEEFMSAGEEFMTVSEDEREISFGPIGIGPNIKSGDYIDVRLMCADGTDYVVVSKKELIDYNASTGMSVIRVRESELLTLNSAMADRNNIKGVTLYAVRYVDPLWQAPADISYQPNDAVSDQIREREYDFK